MWPLIITFARSYAPYVTLPVAAVVGFIGYNIESWYRPQQTNRPSVEKQRDERVIEEILQSSGKKLLEPLSKKTFVPDTIFGKNVSPGLSKPDT